MIEVIQVLTFAIVIINCGLVFYNYKRIEDVKSKMDGERFCRYPDTNVRDILIDYELEKAKKLDKAIQDVEKKVDEKRTPDKY